MSTPKRRAHTAKGSAGAAENAAASTPQTTAPSSPDAVTAPPQSRWLLFGVGAVAAVVALVPWLLTGARLPIQNFWSEIPSALPVVLLPFSQYAVSLIFALLMVGSAAAGIAGRALRARSARAGTTTLVAGVVVIQLLAVVQTALVLSTLLPDTDEAIIYLAGLTAGAVVTVLLGVLATVLIARAPRGGAVIGLTAGAIAFGSWVAALIVPFGSVPTDYPFLLTLVQWIAPVLTGVAIAWAGVGTPGRIVAAVGALLLVWVAPAAMTGIANALGTRVYATAPGEMLDFGLTVFGLALLTPELALRPILATVITAALGLLLRGVIARRRAAQTPAPAPTVSPSPSED
ncbi:hypothetical protein N3K63_11690 [Microbacterium sp. W1N]|uniref:hypothetical protein n=1 Tax=Microbacterium festucae TaxID=2977531 RepID=UPI0021C176E8|nr:hypothetical protein [Microbacterium festucae]MCT9820944.1 hypothetical protein [Microbacterium festucae]